MATDKDPLPPEEREPEECKYCGEMLRYCQCGPEIPRVKEQFPAEEREAAKKACERREAISSFTGLEQFAAETALGFVKPYHRVDCHCEACVGWLQVELCRQINCVSFLRKALAALEEAERQRDAPLAEVDQILGRALGYPPNPDSLLGVCTGEMTVPALADEASARLRELAFENQRLSARVHELESKYESPEIVVGGKGAAAGDRVKELEAIVDKLPKCWTLRDGVVVQDRLMEIGMTVWLGGGPGAGFVSDVVTHYRTEKERVYVYTEKYWATYTPGQYYDSRKAAEAAERAKEETC